MSRGTRKRQSLQWTSAWTGRDGPAETTSLDILEPVMTTPTSSSSLTGLRQTGHGSFRQSRRQLAATATPSGLVMRYSAPQDMSGCWECIQSAAACACDAAVKMARGWFLRSVSHDADVGAAWSGLG